MTDGANSRIGTFVAGALGITGAVVAGREEDAEYTNPAALALLGVLAAYIAGAHARDVWLAHQRDESVHDVQRWLADRVHTAGTLLSAMAISPANDALPTDAMNERLHELRGVFADEAVFVEARISRVAELHAFIRSAMTQLDVQDGPKGMILEGIVRLGRASRIV